MNRILSVFLIALLAMGAAGTTKPALAAETDTDEEGFSAYSVARMKIFQGTAWVRSPDSGEWEETTTNSPITERSRINIPEGSEAELQFHGGQFVLLTGGTEVDLRRFSESNTSFRLRSGEIRFDLPAEDFSPVAVTVPGGGKTEFNVPGRYWLFSEENGQTRLVVRSGEASVSAGKGVHRVTEGKEATIGEDVAIAASSVGGEEETSSPPPLTEEERQAEVPPAAAYELRDYGEWVYSDEYGWVWRPRVADDWSPYYYGRWAWVSPYGWTWVSYEPWGWYPYHFGWWAFDPFFGWCWAPFHSFVSVSFVFGDFRFAHFHRSAFFFPANVRFVRDGRNVRFVPLRPGDRFVRSGLTRSDARLARFNRPLESGKVFVRSSDRSGKTAWRDWSTSRRDHRTVKVREHGVRTGERRGARSGPGREERSTFRPAERERSGAERQERMIQRGQDRPDRTPQREYRGRGSSLGDRGGSASSLRRPERDRRERMGPVRSERLGQGGPSRRMQAPAQVRERRESPYAGSSRGRSSPPAGYSAPGRGYGRPDSPRGNFAPDRSFRQSGPNVRGGAPRGGGGGGGRGGEGAYFGGGRGGERGFGGGFGGGQGGGGRGGERGFGGGFGGGQGGGGRGR